MSGPGWESKAQSTVVESGGSVGIHDEDRQMSVPAPATTPYKGELPLPSLGKPPAAKPKVGAKLASPAHLGKRASGVEAKIAANQKEVNAEVDAKAASPEMKRPLSVDEQASALPQGMRNAYRNGTPEQREAILQDHRQRQSMSEKQYADTIGKGMTEQQAHDHLYQQEQRKLADPGFLKKLDKMKPDDRNGALQNHLHDRAVVNSAFAPVANAIAQVKRKQFFEDQREREKKPGK